MSFCAGVCWGLQLFMSAFPALANWEIRDKWALLDLFDGRVWVFPLVCMVLMVLGCLSGLVLVKSKILGTILVAISIFVMIFVSAFMILSADTGVMNYLVETEWGWLWTTLPRIMIAVLSAGAVGGEFLIWKVVQRYVVR